MKDQVLSVEQMEILIKMGVDTSKASMCWEEHDNLDRGYIYDLHIGYHTAMSASFIPTFTLHDILSILPKSIDVSANGEARLTFDSKGLLEYVYIDYGELCATYHYAEHCTTLIDSAFDMLKYVKENGHI